MICPPALETPAASCIHGCKGLDASVRCARLARWGKASAPLSLLNNARKALMTTQTVWLGLISS